MVTRMWPCSLPGSSGRAAPSFRDVTGQGGGRSRRTAPDYLLSRAPPPPPASGCSGPARGENPAGVLGADGPATSANKKRPLRLRPLDSIRLKNNRAKSRARPNRPARLAGRLPSDVERCRRRAGDETTADIAGGSATGANTPHTVPTGNPAFFFPHRPPRSQTTFRAAGPASAGKPPDSQRLGSPLKAAPKLLAAPHAGQWLDGGQRTSAGKPSRGP